MDIKYNEFDKLLREVYNQYALNTNYDNKEKKYQYADNMYCINLLINNYCIEFALYKKEYFDLNLIVQLCYFRQEEKFAKQGNYQPIIKYLKSILMMEKLEESS